jgi:hypothetical protein
MFISILIRLVSVMSFRHQLSGGSLSGPSAANIHERLDNLIWVLEALPRLPVALQSEVDGVVSDVNELAAERRAEQEAAGERVEEEVAEGEAVPFEEEEVEEEAVPVEEEEEEPEVEEGAVPVEEEEAEEKEEEEPEPPSRPMQYKRPRTPSQPLLASNSKAKAVVYVPPPWRMSLLERGEAGYVTKWPAFPPPRALFGPQRPDVPPPPYLLKPIPKPMPKRW